MSVQDHKENYDVLMSLPLVQKLLRKNKELRRENKALKNLVYSLPEFRCSCARIEEPRAPKIKTEVGIEPTPCETLVEDDEVVFVVEEEKQPNIVYVVDENITVPEVKIKVEKVEVEVEVEASEEAEEEEEEEEEASEAAAEEEASEDAEEESSEAAEAEEEEEEESEAAEEEASEVAEEEESEEEEASEVAEPEAEDQEVFEITIAGKAYYTSSEVNGIIYAIEPDTEDVGPKVGQFKDGKPVFLAKK